MCRDIIKEDCEQFVKLLIDSKLDIEKLKNKTLLITGGTGFFGKWLLTTFLYANSFFKLNSRCVVLSRNSSSFLKIFPEFKNSALKFIDGDVRDFDICESHLDFIIHAATPASATLERDDPAEMRSIIVDGAKHIVEIARKSNSPKILFTSSGGVYGSAIENKPFKETDECIPTTVYGLAKLDAERVLLQSGVEVVVARCFAFVGPYLELDIHYAIGNFINDVIKNRPIVIKGDGTPVRSYMYSLDLMLWLWTLLIRGGTGGIYNVGSDIPVSIKELACLVAGSDTKVKLATRICNEGSTRSYYLPSIHKFEKELGLSLSYALNESITRTLNWNLRKK